MLCSMRPEDQNMRFTNTAIDISLSERVVAAPANVKVCLSAKTLF